METIKEPATSLMKPLEIQFTASLDTLKNASSNIPDVTIKRQALGASSEMHVLYHKSCKCFLPLFTVEKIVKWFNSHGI
ncbi:CLUMA_CG015653, isoform A [Clunio marinus]|uniref:CLUMA_CG015653, isoform A n=1 Tax=Clunio marinus TaxID=568069 RepID=A0A1J1IUU7_9DIPT|nr:CLUMA_CG015653, isoform A [Clunio marinus]